MKTPLKILFGTTMSLALAFGFLHLFVPDYSYDFDRLHIFLFNLCSGGSILLYHAIGLKRMTPRVWTYFGVSLVYALSAFFEVYWLTLIASLPLIVLVESVRQQRFGLFPFDFFRHVHTSEKFLQASLLCLSIGTTVASVVVANEVYLDLFHMEKLTLDVFFLGYSFPLSLLTFSVMYSFMEAEGDRTYLVLKEISFWSINLGVITFFLFIIFEITVPEIIISNLLLAAVIMTYWLFLKKSRRVQPRGILASGMGFLVVTGITGVFYLFEYWWPEIEQYHDLLLVLHATVALYGWNLSGLFIIVRWDDFPIFKGLIPVVALHWLTVLLLAPLGKYSIPVSLLALAAYMLLLGLVFFSRHSKESRS
jgi:hypothetical protein